MALTTLKIQPPKPEIVAFLESQGFSADEVTGITVQTFNGPIDLNCLEESND